MIRNLSIRFRRSVMRYFEQWTRTRKRPAPEPEAVAHAREPLQRASAKRNTRAMGAALRDVRRARTDALRREVTAMRQKAARAPSRTAAE
jgi:hypothetical protein